MRCSCPVRGCVGVCASLAGSGEGQGARGLGQGAPAGSARGRVSWVPLQPRQQLPETSRTQRRDAPQLTGGPSGGQSQPGELEAPGTPAGRGLSQGPGRREPWGPHLGPGRLWAGWGSFQALWLWRPPRFPPWAPAPTASGWQRLTAAVLHPWPKGHSWSKVTAPLGSGGRQPVPVTS